MTLLRVVLDTSNHVKSILYPRGASGIVIDCCTSGRCRLVCSSSIIDELREVLTRPRLRRRYPALTDGAIQTYVSRLRDIADMTPGALVLKGASPDPDDDHVLACGAEGRADYLVTADERHLLSLGAFAGTRIVTAAEFLAVMRSQELL